MTQELHILTPKDEFMPVALGEDVWRVSYAGDDGVMWLFEVKLQDQTFFIHWDHDAFGIVQKDDVVPGEVVDRLRSALTPSKRALTPLGTRVLDVMVGHLELERTTSGRRIRHALRSEHKRRVMSACDALAPRYATLRRGNDDQERYEVRLAGILGSGYRSRFGTFVEELLQWYARRFNDDPDFMAFHWTDLRGSLSETNVALAQHYGEVAGLIREKRKNRLATALSRNEDSVVFSAPKSLEDVVSCGDLRQYLKYLQKVGSKLSPTAPVVEKQPVVVLPLAKAQTVAAKPEGTPKPTKRAAVRPKNRVYETALRTYRYSGHVGDGGNGVVLDVVDEEGDHYALKRLRPGKLPTEKRKRFKNEIFLARQLHHPNIVKVLDYGFYDEDEERYIFSVMPLYPGTLRGRVGELQPLQALSIAVALSNALAYAHQQGVWHRDLKPENVALESDTPVLLDFGIAHISENMMATNVESGDKPKMGNFPYASPEQRDYKPCDERTDVYSLGLMIHEMFTATVPHGHGYDTISSRWPGYKDIDPLVPLLLQHKPANRPSMAEVVEMLERRLDAHS